jgi:pyruvate formate lyase activating enzyme
MNIFAQGWSEGYDGPGRRWVVYLKGCNFRCRWCASPESISPQPQILFHANRGSETVRACPHGAVVEANGSAQLNRDECAHCSDHACTQVVRHPAFQWVGEEHTVEQLVQQALSYRALFGAHGGVTFGGGEPTLQADDLCRAIAALKEKGIHTAVETNASTTAFRQLVDLVDVLICDLKCVTSETHRDWTGVPSDMTLANLSFAARYRTGDLWIRIPVVPGFNTGDTEWDAIVRALAELTAVNSRIRVELLPLHHGGAPKYAALDQKYLMATTPTPATKHLDTLRGRLAETLGSVAVAEQLW